MLRNASQSAGLMQRSDPAVQHLTQRLASNRFAEEALHAGLFAAPAIFFGSAGSQRDTGTWLQMTLLAVLPIPLEGIESVHVRELDIHENQREGLVRVLEQLQRLVRI